MVRSFFAAGTVVLAMLPGLAAASPVATVDALFDPFEQDTVFTITNTSGSTETNLVLTTNFGPTFSVAIPDLGAGQSEQYYFNQPNGGFLVGAGENNLSDSTTYQLTLTLGGHSLQSNVFSPGTNLTGNYVDFLGNTCFGYSDGCAVATSGTVAAINPAVPEPSTWALLLFGFLGVALRLRRAGRQFA